MNRVSTAERPRRREYSVEFKVSVLEQCRQPGASLAGIAMGNGINPNMVHRWMREERQRQMLADLQQTRSAATAGFSCYRCRHNSQPAPHGV